MKIPFTEDFCSGNFVLLNPNFQISHFLIVGAFLLPSHEGHHSLAVGSSNFPHFKQINFLLGTKHAGLWQLCPVPKKSCHKAVCHWHCLLPQTWGMLMCTSQAFGPNLSVIHHLAFHSPQYMCKIVAFEETSYFLFIIIKSTSPPGCILLK